VKQAATKTSPLERCHLRLVEYRPIEGLTSAQFFGFEPITWLDSLDDDGLMHVLFVTRVAIVTEKLEFLVRLESPASMRDAQSFSAVSPNNQIGTEKVFGWSIFYQSYLHSAMVVSSQCQEPSKLALPAEVPQMFA
jgi:hypothetical protein